MKISRVKEILGRRFPDRENWPGREAEIMVLARICFEEEDLIERITNPDLDYIDLIKEQQRIIEYYDPDARIELQQEFENLEQEAKDKLIEDQKYLEDKDGLLTFLQENNYKLSKSEIITLYLNCRNVAEAYELLGKGEFDELLRETERDLENQEEQRERAKENQISTEEHLDWLSKIKENFTRWRELELEKENKGEDIRF